MAKKTNVFIDILLNTDFLAMRTNRMPIKTIKIVLIDVIKKFLRGVKAPMNWAANLNIPLHMGMVRPNKIIHDIQA